MSHATRSSRLSRMEVYFEPPYGGLGDYARTMTRSVDRGWFGELLIGSDRATTLIAEVVGDQDYARSTKQNCNIATKGSLHIVNGSFYWRGDHDFSFGELKAKAASTFFGSSNALRVMTPSWKTSLLHGRCPAHRTAHRTNLLRAGTTSLCLPTR